MSFIAKPKVEVKFCGAKIEVETEVGSLEQKAEHLKRKLGFVEDAMPTSEKAMQIVLKEPMGRMEFHKAMLEIEKLLVG